MSTILGKYLKIKANPYEMRFNAKYEFLDFLKDHENNCYIFNNLLKNWTGVLILFCTIIIVSHVMLYIWIVGGIFFFSYLMHFIFIYNKQQPYTIDIRDFVEKANPTAFDCFKTVQKIAKSAAFTRFYRLLEYYYIKKKYNIQFMQVMQTITISWLLGYNYWCLCVIVDMALVIYSSFQKKDFYTRLKIFIVHELSWKYMLSSCNPKELRIYWFNNSWVFNPHTLKTPLKLWDIKHQHPNNFYIRHLGFAVKHENSTAGFVSFFSRNPREDATGFYINNNNPNIGKQYIVTNQLVSHSLLTEATNYSKILKNCDLNNALACKLFYKMTQFNSLTSKHTVVSSDDGETIIYKNAHLIILDNALSGHTFSSSARRQSEKLLIEKNNNSKLYELYQRLNTDIFDIKNPVIKQYNIKELLNFPIDQYSFESPDQ